MADGAASNARAAQRADSWTMGVPDDEAAEARMRFLALAQHKLNTPLAVINGWSATLLDWDRLDPEERTAGLEAINRGAVELQAQIKDVLDEGRALVLAQSVRPTPIRVGELVGEVLDAFASDAATHRVARDVDEELWVVADDAALRKALHHVLDNAVRYSPDGGAIRLSVRAARGRGVIVVEDEGLGLPEDVDVFEPFRRGNSAAAGPRGSGLGLHVVRCLMTAMDGDVSAVRVAGGTVVELSLPVE